jgi:hypothetical protein
MIRGLSAAEVLSSGLRNVPRPAFARALTDSVVPSKAAIHAGRVQGCSAPNVDGSEMVATAAGALLGLHNEPVFLF